MNGLLGHFLRGIVKFSTTLESNASDVAMSSMQIPATAIETDWGEEVVFPHAHGWLWSQQLQLLLGVENARLRFFTPSGQLIPSLKQVVLESVEAIQQERQQRELVQQQVEQERQQRELAQQQVEAWRAKLRELGIDPDRVDDL